MASFSMNWWLLPFVMVLMIGALCPATGTILLTHRRLMQANLISHAVLPGLAMALAIGIDPAVGGVISGLLGALLAERLVHGHAGADVAVLNTVLAGFLGLGVLLIPLLGLQIDLEAVLFGDLLTVSIADLGRTFVAILALLVFVASRYQQLVYLGVDPEGAAASGMPVERLRFVLALVTALVVVSAMAAVGVVLVIGLLCAPVLIGLHKARSLRQAMVRSSLIGTLIAIGGFLLALLFNLPPGPLIGVLCMGLLLKRQF